MRTAPGSARALALAPRSGAQPASRVRFPAAFDVLDLALVVAGRHFLARASELAISVAR